MGNVTEAKGFLCFISRSSTFVCSRLGIKVLDMFLVATSQKLECVLVSVSFKSEGFHVRCIIFDI
jgi:hypothetical protein